MRDRLPWYAKIAAGMLTPGKWRPFEIYLTTIWTTHYFGHTYLGFPSIKSNGFFSLAIFLLVQTFPNQVLFEFLKKNCIDQILVEQQKIEVLLKKPCYF
jgi:hypothetical protein